jgi:hypothetical protein
MVEGVGTGQRKQEGQCPQKHSSDSGNESIPLTCAGHSASQLGGIVTEGRDSFQNSLAVGRRIEPERNEWVLPTGAKVAQPLELSS